MTFSQWAGERECFRFNFDQPTFFKCHWKRPVGQLHKCVFVWFIAPSQPIFTTSSLSVRLIFFKCGNVSGEHLLCSFTRLFRRRSKKKYFCFSSWEGYRYFLHLCCWHQIFTSHHLFPLSIQHTHCDLWNQHLFLPLILNLAIPPPPSLSVNLFTFLFRPATCPLGRRFSHLRCGKGKNVGTHSLQQYAANELLKGI